MSDEVVQIVVDEVSFRSEDGRFAVVRGTRDPSGEKVVAVGDLGDVAVGESLRLAGRFDEHAQYGRRFTVTSFTPVVPTSAAGVARYLGSGLVPGIGPGLAERLVAKFGARTLDVIATQSARLREVPGIGARRAGAIADAVRSRRDEAEAMSFLHAIGLGPALARRVLRRYGTDAARLLREDPYLVAEEMHGIGFRTADRIGRSAGIAPDDPRRAAGAVLHVLARAADDGHTYVDRETLARDAVALDVPAPLVDAAVHALAQREMVVVDGDAVFPPPLFRAEQRLAANLAGLARRVSTSSPPSALAAADAEPSAATLSDGQRRAVEVSLARGLVVLTGGPGTGKTTAVRAIVRAHESLSRRVVLAAPTGRAAKRLAEATGREARTVHRLLEWNPQTGSFLRGAADPLDADLVLVDEASMLDLPLADALVAALPARATLVFVGDVDQLPPVGAGHVLRELLASDVAAVVRLTEIFRQAQRSRIVQGAHAVLRGEPPTPTPTGDRGDGDLFLVRASEPEAILAKVVETLRRVESAYGLDPKRDVQVLVPMRKGPVGAERLNEVLQAALNPSPGARPGMRPGDKVMQLRNDYERDVFNGDLGEVVRVAGGITTVRIDGRDVAFTARNLDDLALAYACTIHKAQGSEMPAVVIVLHAGHHVMLDRALLYTAITRARKLVVIIGDERAVARAAERADAHRARSKLGERLRALCL